VSARVHVTEDPDGRARYRFHQSWLSDTDLCLERARRGLVGELDETENDATALGTALHAAIEACMDAVLEYGESLDFDAVVQVGVEELDHLAESEGFRWVKRQRRGAHSYLARALRAWYGTVLPVLEPVATEVRIPPTVLYEDDRRIIEVGGTIDYIDAQLGLVDWKSGSPHGWKGKEWEKERWSLQATLYTFAWNALQRGADVREWPPADVVVPFTFVALLDNGTVHTVSVKRRSTDWLWLRRKALNVAYQIERGTDVAWPTNDQHALCSAKWCPAWDTCKGAHVAPTWPR
jgi:hypothetical protein